MTERLLADVKLSATQITQLASTICDNAKLPRAADKSSAIKRFQKELDKKIGTAFAANVWEGIIWSETHSDAIDALNDALKIYHPDAEVGVEVLANPEKELTMPSDASNEDIQKTEAENAAAAEAAKAERLRKHEQAKAEQVAKREQEKADRINKAADDKAAREAERLRKREEAKAAREASAGPRAEAKAAREAAKAERDAARAKAKEDREKAKADRAAAKAAGTPAPRAAGGRRPLVNGKTLFGARVAEDGTLINPRRVGSYGHRSMQIIVEAGANGISTEAFVKAGGRLADLNWDIEHGNVRAEFPGGSLATGTEAGELAGGTTAEAEVASEQAGADAESEAEQQEV